MSENLDWTGDLGDAFLGQKDEVLNTIQRMRTKAYDAGNLKTTKEQVITRDVVNQKEIIKVEPAEPDVASTCRSTSLEAYGQQWT